MQQTGDVAIFWDFESLPAGPELSGNDTVENIRSMAQVFGSVISFKAYLEVSLTPSNLRSELQSSGVSLTDCPRNGNEGIADKMLTTDMIAFAIDHKAPATIVLISNDQGYAYPLSILRFRNYHVVVISSSTAHNNLIAQASIHLDWSAKVSDEFIALEPAITPNHHAFTGSRRSATSSASKLATPSVKSSIRKEEDDDFVYGPRPKTYDDTQPSVPQANGIVQEHVPSNLTSADMPWRHTSSRATSKPYSPPLSFRSAKSPPPTPPTPPPPPPAARTYVTNGETLFESTSHPTLPQGFPFYDAERAITLTAQPSTSGEGVVSEAVPAATPGQFPKVPALVPAFTPVIDSTCITHSPLTSQPPAAPSLPPASPPVFKDAAASAKLSFAPAITPVASSSALPATPVAVVHKLPTAKPATSPAPQTPKPKAKTVSEPSGSRSQAVPGHFTYLISALKDRSQYRGQKIPRTDVGGDMAKKKQAYSQAGVSSFASYMLLAIEAGIVDIGGSGNDQWISLRTRWY